ncbi:MAG: nucleoside hydrolase [Pirellulales bacterium]|nr:nucleoside hydrolase [Pirellulales bacterium]
MPRKIIIDVDPGIDGAVALALALFDPRLEVVAVTATGGRVSSAQATKNVQTIIETLDPPRWPRIGAAYVDQLTSGDAARLHGADGLGNADLPSVGLAKLLSAEKLLVETVRENPEDITLVALGPLTNVARAMHLDHHWQSQVGRVLISGGAFFGPGDVTPAAELSFYNDPFAARQTVKSPMTKTLLPADVARQLSFSFAIIDQLPAETTRVGKFLRKIIPYAMRAQRQELGREDLELNSVAAIVALTNPELFETQEHAIDVETEGTLALGALIADRRNVREWRNNAEVIVSLDAAAVRDCVLRGLALATA